MCYNCFDLNKKVKTMSTRPDRIRAEIQEDLDILWEDYERAVDKLAKKINTKIVKPFLKENKLDFECGNGDWGILPTGFPDNHRYLYHLAFKDLDVSETIEGFTPPSDRGDIVTLLDMEVTGMPTESLGTLMVD